MVLFVGKFLVTELLQLDPPLVSTGPNNIHGVIAERVARQHLGMRRTPRGLPVQAREPRPTGPPFLCA